MEIVEYFEKNNRLKNRKITLYFENLSLRKLYEILNIELNNLKEKIKNTKDEMDIIYNKKNFEIKNALSEIINDIDESILKKKDSFQITYDNFEVLDYAIQQRIYYLRNEKKKWGISLNKDVEKDYVDCLKIYSHYEQEYDKNMKKLYPHKEEIETQLKDYIEESEYYNSLMTSNIFYHIHIKMREKEDFLQMLYDYWYKIENNILKKIEYIHPECDDLNIVLNIDDIKDTLYKVIKELEKDINSGSIIYLNIKEYEILNILSYQYKP